MNHLDHSIVTSLDVIDNFSTVRGKKVWELPGRELWELGNEIRRFAESYTPASVEERSHPVYVGGWPSANFWLAGHSELVMSTLLYSGQILVKDPIIDWFSPARYSVEHVMGSRQGYLTDDGMPAIEPTRNFLRFTVPELMKFRPLIESGRLVLVPGEDFYLSNAEEIKSFADLLMERPGFQVDEVIGRFRPSEMARDDRLRGLFLFAGGDREEQLSKAVCRSLEYFSREYMLAHSYGVEYAAPWRYEQYLCEKGVEKLIGSSPSERVLHAVWSSRVPIFSGLTPDLLSRLVKEDAFVDFRSQLYSVYRDVPVVFDEEEYLRLIGEAEESVLRPILDRAEAAVRRGVLSRLGIEVVRFTLYLSSAVSVDVLAGNGPGLRTGVQGTASYLLAKVLQGGRTVMRTRYGRNWLGMEEMSSKSWRWLSSSGSSPMMKTRGVSTRSRAWKCALLRE